ncbi:MAG: NAD(P)/FAD-dependent oxidoreductase [Bacteroidetes bacterium SW_9_63_38]|nr:MAG: NAD(P)/FAD-dependent oxidoreductase [Bacteroidetes bacterium SW_9_63_38]
MRYDAIVIGGGLAGCSAAAQLARHGHDVVLFEKATYPRHKLCGEFLSPEVQSSLRTLDVMDEVSALGTAPMTRARLTGPDGTRVEHALPGTALGLSRYRLDELLFDRACAWGTEGRPGTKVTAVTGSLAEGFAVTAGGDTVEGRLVLGAYGRRGVLDRTLDRPFLQQQAPSVAFKAHYTGDLEAITDTIEVHAAPGGYCGIGPVEDGRANVCWIGRTDALTDAGGTPTAMLEQALYENPVLRDRLRGWTRASEQFEAVSQVPLMPKRQFVDDVCMVGDAAGMIAPLCGDGMAMALSAADLVAPLADDLLSGRRSAPAFKHAYETQWSNQFGRRLRVGRWVHRTAFHPTTTRALLTACRLLPPLARWLIRTTRG